MFQIRFSKPASESDGGKNPVPAGTVTVACADHLVLADLPVAKGLGPASVTAVTKIVGRRSRRQLGERVCLNCDFPIAIYGRLSPCEHAFCLDCARTDSLCFICDERILKIQTIKRTGVFICAIPYCLKSFLGKTEFESHINKIHASNHPNKRQKEMILLLEHLQGPFFLLFHLRGFMIMKTKASIPNLEINHLQGLPCTRGQCNCFPNNWGHESCLFRHHLCYQLLVSHSQNEAEDTPAEGASACDMGCNTVDFLFVI